MRVLNALVVAIAVSAVLSLPARAAQISLDFALPSFVPNPSAVPPVDAGVFEGVTGSIGGLRRSPWEDQGPASGNAYTSISGGASATYQFGFVANSLRLMWGSVDTYNFIDFLRDGGLVETVGGTELLNINPQAADEGVGFVVASIMPVSPFDSIVLRSDSNAFEFSSLEATPVPVPPALLLMASALAGLGFLGRRRRPAA